MYNYPGGNGYPPPYYPYPPAPTPRRRSVAGRFLILAAIVFGVAYLSVKYQEGGTLFPDPTDGSDQGSIGFRILPNDPLIDQQYALQRINAPQAWTLTQGDSNLVVAVIDTGVDASHPDLMGKLVKGYDFVNNDNIPEDMVGHGTFVASLIAARNNNKDEAGISGIAPNVKIMPLKVMNQNGEGNSLLVGRAIRYAADNGAKVINLSLGGNSPSRSVKAGVDYALSKGLVIVAAAGNEGDENNLPNYPASFAGVISVAATGSRDTAALFSNYNKGVTVSAPGVNILGARSQTNQICRPYRSPDYCIASGTSFAAPYVSGTVALLLSINPKLSVSQVTAILEKSAKDLGPKGRDDHFGYGRIDAGKAVELAKAA